jgi:hypothetical protein
MGWKDDDVNDLLDACPGFHFEDGQSWVTAMVPLMASSWALADTLSIHGLQRAMNLLTDMRVGVQTRPAQSRLWQCGLIREAFGPLPFRRISVDPSWLAWQGGTVVKLATSIYNERRFEDMGVLSDALEEAGCQDQEILRHCRQQGSHYSGCWLIDLLLYKE